VVSNNNGGVIMKMWIARDEYNLLGLFFEKPEYTEQLRC
jgi:hypothetical protein